MLPVLVSDQGKAAATEAAGLGVGDGQDQRDGDRRVRGGTTLGEYVGTDSAWR